MRSYSFLDPWYWREYGNTLINEYTNSLVNATFGHYYYWNLTLINDGPLHHLRNTNNGKVLGISNSKLIEEDFVEGKIGQLWVKFSPKGGFFSLRNAESSMVLIATSKKKLELKGSILVKITGSSRFFF